MQVDPATILLPFRPGIDNSFNDQRFFSGKPNDGISRKARLEEWPKGPCPCHKETEGKTQQEKDMACKKYGKEADADQNKMSGKRYRKLPLIRRGNSGDQRKERDKKWVA
jgi:hypothetical protein